MLHMMFIGELEKLQKEVQKFISKGLAKAVKEAKDVNRRKTKFDCTVKSMTEALQGAQRGKEKSELVFAEFGNPRSILLC
jgi:hypothetical protein